MSRTRITTNSLEDFSVTSEKIKMPLSLSGNLLTTGTISCSSLSASNIPTTDGTIKNIISISQVAYDALSPNYVATTLYVIV